MVELPVPRGVDPDDPAYVENPVTSERFRFHTRPEQPATDPLEFDLWASPDMTPLGAHVHPEQVESFAVESGTIELSRDGTTETVSEGDEVAVQPDTPHTWRPVGEADHHLTVRFQPGLASEQFLRDLAMLAQDGAVKANGVPSLFQVAAIYDAYGYDVMHLANPPLPVQKALFGALAPVARVLGYRAKPVRAQRG